MDVREDDKIDRALVGMAIEKVLLDFNDLLLDNVTRKLTEYYNCYIFDCVEHPEYLVRVLKEVYGDSYTAIIKSINTELKEFLHRSTIKNFRKNIAK